jgi:hypothetical protein
MSVLSTLLSVYQKRMLHMHIFPYVLMPRPFLGAFAKSRKTTISFVMSVRLNVRMEQFGSHRTDFLEI